MIKSSARIGVLTVVLFLVACGGSLLASLRTALSPSVSDPLINSLVASGMPAPLANHLRTDFRDGVGCASVLESEFKTIPSDAPDKKGRKLNASVSGARCFKVIVDRQNFAQNPRTQTISGIVEGIFASLVAFYSEDGEIRAERSSGVKVITASDEKELEKKLKAEVDRLEKIMKGE